MKSLMRYALITVLATTAAIGCKSSEKSGKGEGPAKLSAQELFAHKDAQKGKKVIVTGAVKSIGDRPGDYEIDLDAGPDRSIKVVFADKGVAAKAKNLSQGTSVTTQCDVIGFGKAGDEFVMTSDCVLQ